MGVSRVIISTENTYSYKNNTATLLLCARQSVVGKARIATGGKVRNSITDWRLDIPSSLKPVQTAPSCVQHPSRGSSRG
jgi:hypothetical protein